MKLDTSFLASVWREPVPFNPLVMILILFLMPGKVEGNRGLNSSELEGEK